MIAKFRQARILGFMVVALSFAGCASVKVPLPMIGDIGRDEASSGHSERVALKRAGEAMTDQPWAKAAEPSMVNVMFGRGKRRGRTERVEAYLANLGTSPAEQMVVVMADADHALAQARWVAEAGRQAATAAAPLASDIDILEQAIVDVRECRLMYVKALEILAGRDAGITRQEVRTVRDAFSQTLVDIGQTADLVALNVRKAGEETRLAKEIPETSLATTR